MSNVCCSFLYFLCPLIPQPGNLNKYILFFFLYFEKDILYIPEPSNLNKFISFFFVFEKISSTLLKQAEQRPQVVFGSHSQFEVKRHFMRFLDFQIILPDLSFLPTLSDRISKSVKCLLRRLGLWLGRTSSTADLSTTYRSSSEPDRKYDFPH